MTISSSPSMCRGGRRAEDAFAFLRAQVAGVSRRQSAPGRAVARIGENVRRAVGEHEPRAGVIAQRQLLLALDEMRAHHAGDRIAVAEPEAVEPEARPAASAPRHARPRAGTRSSRRRRIRRSRASRRIHPVQEPARRGGRAPCRDRAPRGTARSAARLVLDAEIIARGPAFLAPPFAFDALGPLGRDHLVQRATPAEAHRRAVGHQRQRILDRLGPGEQAQRPRAQVSLDAEAAERLPAELGSRHDLCRESRGRELGDMAVMGDEAATLAGGRAARSGGRRGDRARLDLRVRRDRSARPDRARR